MQKAKELKDKRKIPLPKVFRFLRKNRQIRILCFKANRNRNFKKTNNRARIE